MIDPIYRKLAQRLDSVPNGFASTKSGVELRLLEAAGPGSGAGQRHAPHPRGMGRDRCPRQPGAGSCTPHTQGDGAQRTDQGRPRGPKISALACWPLLWAFTRPRAPRLDAELAALVEQYFQEIHGGTVAERRLRASHSCERGCRRGLGHLALSARLGYHRGRQGLGRHPLHLSPPAKTGGQGLRAAGGELPGLRPVPGAFDHSQTVRAVTKEQALQVLRQAEEAGLVHTTMNHQAPANYICNCCACCCGVLRGLTEFGKPAAVANSGFQSTVDAALCTGCGACTERCPTHAVTVRDDVAMVQVQRCIGCGLCVVACPSGALSLAPHPQSERVAPPVDMADWLVRVRGSSRHYPQGHRIAGRET